MGNSSFIGKAWRGFTNRIHKTFSNPYRKADIGLLKLKIYKHLSNGPLRQHKLHGHFIYFTSPTELLHGLKEIFIEEIYQQELGPDPYILDCGSNIGLSVIYLKEKFPSATIIAFEPDEKNISLLKKNIASFGFRNISVRQEAVWIENTELQFASDASMSSRIDQNNNSNTITVKACRLRDLLDRPIDFLKIDIEGAEYRVLMDIKDKLSIVKNLFIEYHGSYEQHGELSEILNLLSENGFHYYIREAAPIYTHPFIRIKEPSLPYDVQLNIFCQKEY